MNGNKQCDSSSKWRKKRLLCRLQGGDEQQLLVRHNTLWILMSGCDGDILEGQRWDIKPSATSSSAGKYFSWTNLWSTRGWRPLGVAALHRLSASGGADGENCSCITCSDWISLSRVSESNDLDEDTDKKKCRCFHRKCRLVVKIFMKNKSST